MIINKVKKLVQSFPGACPHCSKNGDIKNFDLYREYYELKVGAINLKFFDNTTTYCRSCSWYASLPEIVSRKIFKRGINPQNLLNFSKNLILRSWLITHYATLWNTVLILLVILTGFIIFRYFTDSVIISEPQRISVEESRSVKYQGQIVTVYGIVDYTESYAKITTTEKNGVITESYEEIYLPLYKNGDQNEYILIRGGSTEIAKIRSRESLRSDELLKNQSFELTGRLEKIESIVNKDVIEKFTTELANKNGISPTSTVINSTRNITIENFISQFINSYLILVSVFVTSLFLQIYIDKKIY